MAEAAEILSALAVRDLKSLAAEAGVDVAGCKSKGDFVKRLSASSTVQIRLQAPSYRVRPVLASKSVPELQNLAAEHQVDVAGCEKKADYVERIAMSPAAERVLGARAPAMAAPPLLPKVASLPPLAALPPMPVLADEKADRLIAQGRNQDVDFGLVEDIVDQARMRFEERNYDRSLEMAREALVLSRGTMEAFEKSAWAYALLAAQRLIEESGRVGRDVEPAARLLRDAKVVYATGSLTSSEALLAKLQEATKALYSEEVQRLRQVLFAAQEKVAQSRHIGADVATAEESLGRARDAMRRAEHAAALQMVHEGERLADEALGRRVQEIGAALPATDRAIEEARHVGADVTEAMRLLEKARVAMDRKEYVLAAELVARAERATLQSQHFQIQKAMELRMRQIEKGHGLVNYLLPIVDEAASYDFPIEEVKRLLTDARGVLDQGDYVNGTLLAKQAEESLRMMVPRLAEERGKRGITKPPAGRCGTCGAADVAFLDDGWSRCAACGAQWRWRAPSGLWERFRALLRE